MKHFVGYYILGAADHTAAVKERGLLIWLEHRPGYLKRKFNELLLGIYWVDKVRTIGAEKKPLQNPAAEHSLPQRKPKIKVQKRHESV